MAAKTFSGGVQVPHYKELTEHLPIREGPRPTEVVIPLSQHTGAPCEPTVRRGERVLVGQKVGDSEAFVSAPVHASVSGKVVAIEPRPHPLGGEVLAVVIESDGEFAVHPEVKPLGPLEELSPEQIKRMLRESGMVGLGGAAFPTAVKVSPPEGKHIDVFLLNGAECEPYLTADHRLMVEHPEDVVLGMRALMKALGVGRGIVCVEDNKPDAIEAMKKATMPHSELEVAVCRTKYPQGSEKQLIKAVLGREVPPPPGLPLDVGVVVNNVGTAWAVARALTTGLPLVERVITVTGPCVAQPANLLVRIGTPFSSVVDFCGGFASAPAKIIMGGPMMGVAQRGLEVPVIKGTSGLLLLPEEDALAQQPQPCIRCGRCVEACPMGLLPLLLAAYAEQGRFEEAESLRALNCMECGSCSYICPARRPLVHAIRVAKADIMARLRARRK